MKATPKMTKAQELFPTLESLKPYIGEVWEDEDGCKRKLLMVDDGEDAVVCRDHSSGKVFAADIVFWLGDNNLPLSIRNAQKAVDSEPAVEPPKTLRDEFAMAALQGMLANSNTSFADNSPTRIAAASYDLADAMLEARKGGGDE
jgi:hypothetical protein